MTAHMLKWHTRMYIMGSTDIHADWAFPLELCDNKDPWLRLEEIEDDWKLYDLVGILPAELCTTPHITSIEHIIHDASALKSGYYQCTFATDITKYTSAFLILIEKICKIYKLNNTVRTDAPWICSVDKMQRFIAWYKATLLPVISLFDETIVSSEYYKRSSEKDVLQIRTLIVRKLAGAFFDTDGDDDVLKRQFQVYEQLNISHTDVHNASANADNSVESNIIVLKDSTTKFANEGVYSEMMSVISLTDNEFTNLRQAELDLADMYLRHNSVKKRYEQVVLNQTTLNNTIIQNEQLIKDNLTTTEHLKTDIAKQHSLLEEINSTLDSTKKDYKLVNNKRNEVFAELVSIKEMLNQEKTRLKTAEQILLETTAQHDAVHTQYIEANNSLDRMNKAIVDYKSTTEENKKQCIDMMGDVSRYASESEAIKMELANIQVEFNKVNAVKNDLLLQKESLQESRTNEQTEIDSMERDIAKTAKQIEIDMKYQQELIVSIEEKNATLEKLKNTSVDYKTQMTYITEEIENLNILLTEEKTSLSTAKIEFDTVIAVKNDMFLQRESLQESSNKEKCNIASIEQDIANTAKQIEKDVKYQQDLFASIEAKNKTLEKLKSTSLEYNTQLSSMAAEIGNLNKLITEEKSTLNAVKADFTKTVAVKNNIVGNIASTKEQIKKIEQMNITNTKQFEKNKKTCAELNALYDKKIEALETNNKTISETRNKIEIIDEENTKLKVVVEETKLMFAAFKEEYDTISAKNKQFMEQVNGLKDALKKEVTQTTSYEKEITHINACIEEEKIKFTKLSSDITGKRSTLENTQKLIEGGKENIILQDALIEKAESILTDIDEEYSKKKAMKRALDDDILALNKLLGVEEDGINQATTTLTEISEKKENAIRNRDAITLSIKTTEIALEEMLNFAISSEETLATVTEDIAKQKIITEELQNTLADSETEFETIVAANRSLNEQLMNINTFLDNEIELTNKLEMDINTLTNKKEDIVKYRGDLAATLHNEQTMIEEITAETISLTQNISSQRITLAELNATFEEVTALKNRLSAQVEKDKECLHQETDIVNSMKGEIEAISKKITAMRETYNAASAHLENVTCSFQLEIKQTEDAQLQADSITQQITKQKLLFEDTTAQLASMKIQQSELAGANLEATAELTSLQDILSSELEHINSIKADIAEASKRKDDMLRSKHETMTTLEMTQKTYDKEKQAKDDANSKLMTLKGDIDTLTLQNNDTKALVSAKKIEYERALTEKDDITNQILISNRSLTHELEQIKHAESALTEINVVLETHKHSYKELTTLLQKKNTTMEENVRTIEDLKIKMKTIEDEIMHQNSLIATNTQSFNVSKKEFDSIVSEKKIVVGQLTEITELHRKELEHYNMTDASIKALANQYVELKNKNIESCKLLELKREQFETDAAHIEEYKKEIKTLENELYEKNINITNTTRELAKVKEEYDTVSFTKVQTLDALTTAKLQLKQEQEYIKSIQDTIADTNVQTKIEEDNYSALIIELKNNNDTLHSNILRKKELEDTLISMRDELALSDKNYTTLVNQIETQKTELELLLNNKYKHQQLWDNNAKIIRELYMENQTESQLCEYVTAVTQSNTPVTADVKIYILCHTESILKEAIKIYKQYSWATPILMKYQDATFENAFWKQLYEIRDDWYSVRMVGTLSFKAFKKLNLSIIDAIIKDPTKWSTGYFHFMRTNKSVPSNAHPHLIEILTSVCRELELDLPNENCCNYWMCTPDKMIRFLIWFEERARQLVMNHPLSSTDAKYKTGSLKREELIKLSGLPHYTHAPFVFERLFLSFFLSLE